METSLATKKPRISQLAKDLGVNFKDILAKCRAEGVEEVSESTTHQATISAGLAATIRDWFSTGSVSTAVETAEKIDIEQAKARAEKPAKKAKKKSTTDAETDKEVHAPVAVAPSPIIVDAPTSSAVLPPPAAEKSVSTTPAHSVTGVSPARATVKAAASIAPAPRVSIPAPLTGAAASSAAASATSAPVSAPSAKVSHDRPDSHASDHGGSSSEIGRVPHRRPLIQPHHVAPPVMNKPVRPAIVAPAGERLVKPEKTRVSGPNVIRIEHPEPVREPRRSPPGAGPSFGIGLPPRGGGAGVSRSPVVGRDSDRSRGGVRPGVAGRGGTARPGKPEEAGRSEPWRPTDIAERDTRLAHSGGYFRIHRSGGGKRGGATTARPAVTKATGPVRISAPFTVKELSAATGVKAGEILGKLLLAGAPTTINSVIDPAMATEVMAKLRVEIEVAAEQTGAAAVEMRRNSRARTDERPRSPVVTILGHVDHGKTSLLDRIRNANVAQGEAGGITQATSAFSVQVKVAGTDRRVTFIDTPGHEAFTAMRARGARVTDIVVLVVAADDGVMPQTVESIKHAKAAGVPIVVALNKIDKPEATEANLQRIFGQLAEHELTPTDWSGKTELARTSATKGIGIENLLEILALEAEVLALKGDFAGSAQGTVLEAELVEGRGAVARVLVQEGVLRKGDFVAIGRAFGRVRDIVDDRGNRVLEAGPSTPVAISGLDALPDAGDEFTVVEDLRTAEKAAMEIRQTERQRELATPKITLDNIFEHLGKSKQKSLPVVVKADVQGSVETLRSLLPGIKNGDISLSVKHCAVGGINESDVQLAAATGAIVVGFNVTTMSKARALAEQKKVDIRLYEVIYHLTEDLEKAVAGLLEPEIRLEVLGHAEVRAVFRISKVGAIAGCYITDGVVERNAQIRVTRAGIVIEKDRRLEQLKRFKDDAKEVRTGMECGMKIAGYDNIREGDVLECYKSTVVPRSGSKSDA